MDKKFTFKDWESRFFNRAIFDFNVNSAIDEIETWPANALITTKINASDYASVNLVNSYDFHFAEGELVFQKNIIPKSTNKAETVNKTADYLSYLATESEIGELKLIVSNLYQNSRFREPWFTAAERVNFYQTWLEKAVLSQFDDCCLILKDNNNIAGFVTIRLIEHEAIIGLIGVAQSFQGQGNGKKLLQLVEQYCIAKRVEKITVATQVSNIAAANLYSKHKFMLSDISYWFYKKV